MDRDIWRGRRVLLTGHTGFKGAWLALWLQHLEAEVTGYALAPATEPHLFELAEVAASMRSILGDIRDREALAEAFAAARPEVVLHLAAQSLVRQGYAEPVETFAVNVLGTAQVLDACRQAGGVRAVVVVTTDKCYENHEWDWPYRETDALGGKDPYASSKACAELVTAAYRASYFEADGPAVATARAGNVIGGGDWSADRLVPDIVRAVASGSPIHIRSPQAVRPWQHVLEPLAGYLGLAEQLLGPRSEDYCGAWNFGPSEADSRSVAWLLDALGHRWPELRHSYDRRQHPHEAQLLRLDSSKARQQLGWRPRLPLEEALDWLTDWHRAHLRGEAMAPLTRRQIMRYEERLGRPADGAEG